MNACDVTWNFCQCYWKIAYKKGYEYDEYHFKKTSIFWCHSTGIDNRCSWCSCWELTKDFTVLFPLESSALTEVLYKCTFFSSEMVKTIVNSLVKCLDLSSEIYMFNHIIYINRGKLRVFKNFARNETIP